MWLKNIDENTVKSLARESALAISEGRFFLRGSLGSGKSTFVRAWLKTLLGESVAIPSPSYSLVESYADGQYCHADLYRLATAQEWLDIGGQEYFENSKLCFIEWPERLGDAALVRWQPDAVFYFWHQSIELRNLLIVPFSADQENYWQALFWQRFTRR
jgi:tRNA threonylcarbamoyl adenosine modification protein YjeE